MDELAVLGHEVRNLIATFVGFSELLLSQDWPVEKRREYLETMRDEGIRVSQFLNELLDLQRMEAGATTVKARETDVATLLLFAADVAAHDRRHPVELHLPPELPAAMAEPDRVQQVLGNLLSNARKYSPCDGPIHLSASATATHVEISVEDRGVGIPAEAIERVFDKFFRVNGQAKKVSGLGLGLAVCRQIVEAHGGRIWAESAGAGHGSRFTFTLPLASVVLANSARRLARGRRNGVVERATGDLAAHGARSVPRAQTSRVNPQAAA